MQEEMSAAMKLAQGDVCKLNEEGISKEYILSNVFAAMSAGSRSNADAVRVPKTSELVAKQIRNAIIRRELASAGLEVFGGEQAPYVWLKTPDSLDSWGFFDRLLSQAHVVGTPGSGFGAAGEGYFRLSAFNSRENVQEAMGRIRAL